MRFARVLFSLVIVPTATVLLAYFSGNSGYQTFIAFSMALAVLFALYWVRVIAALFHSNYFWLAKIIATLFLMFFAACTIGIVAITLTAAGHDPRIAVPHINWYIALAMALTYITGNNMLRWGQANLTFTSLPLLLRAGTLFYGIILCFAASEQFFTKDAGHSTVVLVVAMQIQYVASYVVLNSSLLERVIAIGEWPAEKFGTTGTARISGFSLLGLVFLPLFLLMLF